MAEGPRKKSQLRGMYSGQENARVRQLVMGKERKNQMKLFVLEVLDTWDNPINVFVAVFSSRKKAEKAAKKYATITKWRKLPPDWKNTSYTIERKFDITEIELDPEDIGENLPSY